MCSLWITAKPSPRATAVCSPALRGQTPTSIARGPTTPPVSTMWTSNSPRRVALLPASSFYFLPAPLPPFCCLSNRQRSRRFSPPQAMFGRHRFLMRIRLRRCYFRLRHYRWTSSQPREGRCEHWFLPWLGLRAAHRFPITQP